MLWVNIYGIDKTESDEPIKFNMTLALSGIPDFREMRIWKLWRNVKHNCSILLFIYFAMRFAISIKLIQCNVVSLFPFQSFGNFPVFFGKTTDTHTRDIIARNSHFSVSQSRMFCAFRRFFLFLVHAWNARVPFEKLIFIGKNNDNDLDSFVVHNYHLLLMIATK